MKEGITKEIISKTEITEIKPSSMSEEIMDRLKLIELVSKGYGLKGTPFDLKYYTMREYQGDDDKKTSFFATSDGQALGSITLKKWSIREKESGIFFWQELEKKSKKYFDKAVNLPMTAYVDGIIVHPEFRRNNIAKMLYGETVRKLMPAFIIGDTKTPQAVMARANILEVFGYRTFYGDFEVTPSRPKANANEALPVIEAMYAAEQCTLEEGIWYAGTSSLNPDVPDVSNFPQYIKDSFKDVISAQLKVQDGRTAVKPLITIRSDIIPSNP